ncbi:MAG TPA: cytochrome c [Gammaproteobacteria bacterium]|nr:cytochrome c [Gammaproteobacteria bacterium]
MAMVKNRKSLFSAVLFFSPAVSVFAAEVADTESLFKQKCLLCHAIDKKKSGPAVNAMSGDAETLRNITTTGKGAMPGYGGKLTVEEIDVLVDYLLANQKPG